MTDDRIWAHCPRCKHTQRFVRVETKHLFHAGMTVLTVGLWAISWIAIIIGHRVWPWRCKHCGCNDPDLTKRRPRTDSEKPTGIKASSEPKE